LLRVHEEHLRRLAMNDTRRVIPAAVLTLDPRTRAMIDIAILVAVDGPVTAFETATSAAIAAGATEDELVEVLIAAAPTVGTAHVVAAAPKLALAMGYDLDAAFETLVPRPASD
jgi:alkylhydroperoxidase/carboxymuconolactone decarboxylase family protein YurZ